MQEIWVRSLSWEDPLEEGMATHSSFLACLIPMGRGAWWLQSMGSQRVGMIEQLSTQHSYLSIGIAHKKSVLLIFTFILKQEFPQILHSKLNCLSITRQEYVVVNY